MVYSEKCSSDGLPAGLPEFDSLQRQEISLYLTASRPALGPTQFLVRCVRGALSPRASIVGIATDWTIEGSEFESLKIFLFSTPSRLALGSTQPPI
jgi:hypothetical protein